MATISASSLAQQEKQRRDTWHDRVSRVKVYTTGGTQIGLPGVGENANRLTFPRNWLVKDALQETFATWIRFSTHEELSESPEQWWQVSEVQPQFLAHCDGCRAWPEHEMGLVGLTMTASTQPTINEGITNTVDEEKYAGDEDIDNIPTPPTPPWSGCL